MEIGDKTAKLDEGWEGFQLGVYMRRAREISVTRYLGKQALKVCGSFRNPDFRNPERMEKWVSCRRVEGTHRLLPRQPLHCT